MKVSQVQKSPQKNQSLLDILLREQGKRYMRFILSERRKFWKKGTKNQPLDKKSLVLMMEKQMRKCVK